MVEHDFIIDEVLEFLLLEVVELKIKVKGINQVVSGLILRTMQLLHIRMGKSLVNGISLFWIKSKKLFQQIDGFRVGALENQIEILSFLLGKGLDEFLILLKSYLSDEIFIRSTY